MVKARVEVWWRSGAGFMLKGCRGWSGDGLPETIGVISSGGHMQSWFLSSLVEVMTV